MSRGAGRVFTTAPYCYLYESASHSQETWEEMTSRGESETQREYIIREKANQSGMKNSSRGRKMIPPNHWLSEDDENTMEKWNTLSRVDKLMIRMKYTTGKYRKKTDKDRKMKRDEDFFTTEKRGRPAKISDAMMHIFTSLTSLIDMTEFTKKDIYIGILSFIESKYADYVEKFFFPLIDAMWNELTSAPLMDFSMLCKKLLSSSKIMNLRIKALNDIWDRTKGNKKDSRQRRFKYPTGYQESEEKWNHMQPMEQLFTIHDLELMRYIELDKDETTDFIDDVLMDDNTNDECNILDEDKIPVDDLEYDINHATFSDEATLSDEATINNLIYGSEQYISV